MPSYSLTELLRRWLVEGDASAECEFAERYCAAVKAIAPRMIGDDLRSRLESSDMAHEAFLGLLADRSNFREKTKRYSHLTPFLMAAAINDIRNERNKHRTQARTPSKEVPRSNDPEMEDAGLALVDLADYIDAIRRRIPSQDWAADTKQRRVRLVDLFLAGMTGTSELACQLGVTDRQVRRDFKAIGKIGRELNEDKAELRTKDERLNKCQAR